MKKILLTLLLIAVQQIFVFAQRENSLSLKNVHIQEFKHHFSHKTQLNRLKSFPKMMNKSMNNTTIISLPDTIIEYSIDDTTRSIYTYDDNGNFLSWTGQQYLNPEWENYEKESYTHDDKDNPITYLYEVWKNDSWVGDYRSAIKFDDKGNEIEDVSEEWTGDSWEVSYQSKTSNIYDPSGNLTSIVGEKYENNEWINAYRYEYTYDALGNLLTELEYEYGSDPWLFKEKTTYTYDTNNNLLTELNQYYSGNMWSNGSLRRYIYDSNGNVIKKTYQDLDYDPGISDPWYTEFDTISYEYDLNGNLLSIGESQIYSYDSNGNMSTWDFYTWDSDLSQWIKKWSEPCLVYIQTDYTGTIWNYPVRKFGNGILFFTYGSGNKMIFHWTELTNTGVNRFDSNNGVNIFPNPTNSNLTIKGIDNQSIVKVYSLDGKHIITNTISDNNDVLNVSQLISGIYILKIETPKGIIIEKFIKE